MEQIFCIIHINRSLSNHETDVDYRPAVAIQEGMSVCLECVRENLARSLEKARTYTGRRL